LKAAFGLYFNVGTAIVGYEVWDHPLNTFHSSVHRALKWQKSIHAATAGLSLYQCNNSAGITFNDFSLGSRAFSVHQSESRLMEWAADVRRCCSHIHGNASFWLKAYPSQMARQTWLFSQV
jgi:hypothetical protein